MQSIKSINAQAHEEILHDLTTPLITAKLDVKFLTESLLDMQSIIEQEKLQGDIASNEKIHLLIDTSKKIQRNIDIVNTKIRELKALYTEEPVISYPTETPSNTTKIARILLVEDEPIHQEIGKQLLSAEYHIDIASNGLDAIKKCKENYYDVILMDLQMPRMNGVSATEDLRKFLDDDVIIIGLTSMPLGEKKLELIDIGFNEFIEKPLRLESLYHTLQLVHSTDAKPLGKA